jgi:hypothetical protein
MKRDRYKNIPRQGLGFQILSQQLREWKSQRLKVPVLELMNGPTHHALKNEG